MEEHSLFWATAGHIPANKAVTESADYKAMQPQATYATLTANMVFDPKSKFAGVASPLFDAAGNAFTAAINGEVGSEGGGRRDEGDPRRSEVASRSANPAGSVRAVGRDLPRRDGGSDAEEQAQRDPRRGRSGRALRRDLRLAVRLSDHPDGAAELHQRAADRGRRLDRPRQLLRGSFNDRVFGTAVWNTAYFVAADRHSGHRGGARHRADGEPPHAAGRRASSSPRSSCPTSCRSPSST